MEQSQEETMWQKEGEQESRVFTMKRTSVVFKADFESSNILKACERQSEYEFDLWIRADPHCSYKTWFYFSIENVPAKTTVTFTVNNMSNQVKLFKQGHRPVYKCEKIPAWKSIPTPIEQNGVVKAQEGYKLTFKHCFESCSKHYFAFSFPFTNAESDFLISSLIQEKKPDKVFALYSNFAKSFQNRPLKILTVTRNASHQSKGTEDIQYCTNGGFQTPMFPRKRGIFISARVHPGEVASSHMMNGILNQLLSDSPISQKLLSEFVVYLIPIINVDGVANGNFRTDSQGKNLNRFYEDPDPKLEPEIFAIKSFLKKMIGEKKIEFCLDLHGHVNKQGAFIYGNSVPHLKEQTEVCLFPKMMQFNCPFFDYEACNFSENNMSSKDKSDQLSKEGAARVAIYKETGLAQCWTLECNYNSSRFTNRLPKAEPEQNKTVSNRVLTEKLAVERNEQSHRFRLEDFEAIGRSICETIVDYFSLGEAARYYSGRIKNRQNFVINTSIDCLRLIPFRFDNACRQLLNGINSNPSSSECIDKVKKKLFTSSGGTSKTPTSSKLVALKTNSETDIQKTKEIEQKSKGSVNTSIGHVGHSKINSEQKIQSLKEREANMPKVKTRNSSLIPEHKNKPNARKSLISLSSKQQISTAHPKKKLKGSQNAI